VFEGHRSPPRDEWEISYNAPVWLESVRLHYMNLTLIASFAAVGLCAIP
jgi:hypothetical protein